MSNIWGQIVGSLGTHGGQTRAYPQPVLLGLGALLITGLFLLIFTAASAQVIHAVIFTNTLCFIIIYTHYPHPSIINRNKFYK